MDIKLKQVKKLQKPQGIELKTHLEQKPVQRYIIADGALATRMKNLVEVMVVVNTKSPQAQLNATSISDNKGGRIQLNDPTVPQPDFKKVTGG